MQHDGEGNSCNPNDNIMASGGNSVGSEETFKWSACSANYLSSFRAKGSTSCLQDGPAGATVSPTTSEENVYTADQQCQAMHGPESKLCPWQDMEVINT